MRDKVLKDEVMCSSTKGVARLKMVMLQV